MTGLLITLVALNLVTLVLLGLVTGDRDLWRQIARLRKEDLDAYAARWDADAEQACRIANGPECGTDWGEWEQEVSR